jgi:hypothetical protein
MTDSNFFPGTIPTEFGRLSNLTYLDIGKIDKKSSLVVALVLVAIASLMLQFYVVTDTIMCFDDPNDRCQQPQWDDPNGVRTAFQSHLFGYW